jgi:hypothetical protein
MSQIDYLPEDKLIPSQQFALITIIGPNMKAKCDVYGMKVRGVCSNLEETKTLSKRIMEDDNTFDIYTVPIGKFFPLNVSDDKSIPVEYQNEELNKLMKNYMESTENSHREWQKQKNLDVEKANTNVTEKEHIYTVHNTILNVKLEIKNLEKELDLKRQRLIEEEERIKNDYTEQQTLLLAKYLNKELSEEESNSFLQN